MAQTMLQARLRVGFDRATISESTAQSQGMKAIPQEMKTGTGGFLREMVAARINTHARVATDKIAKWASEERGGSWFGCAPGGYGSRSASFSLSRGPIRPCPRSMSATPTVFSPENHLPVHAKER